MYTISNSINSHKSIHLHGFQRIKKQAKREIPFSLLAIHLLEESVDNLLFRLFLCEPQRHELNQLLTCDLANCRFMN